MYLFGIELEGFRCTPTGNSVAQVIVPNESDPVDGFPGLVELRSTGGKDLAAAMGEIEQRRLNLVGRNNVAFNLPQAIFDGGQMAFLRRERHFAKDRLTIRNIYGKAPRRLGNKTLASVQLNISRCVSPEWRDKDVIHPARYGLFDVFAITKALDQEFANEIRESNRQPGMFAIKDDIRYEYRSLPNFAYEMDFYDRVSKVVAATLMRN